jgi:segregation and condensation protein B
VDIGGGFSFAPERGLWEALRGRYGRSAENRLSRAALETLAIIAYSQPITRAEIESIRGVQADGMIRLLVSRSLIREVGRKEAVGRPVQYGTTKEFLKAFRLASIADLPKLDGLERERFEQEEADERPQESAHPEPAGPSGPAQPSAP